MRHRVTRAARLSGRRAPLPTPTTTASASSSAATPSTRTARRTCSRPPRGRRRVSRGSRGGAVRALGDWTAARRDLAAGRFGAVSVLGFFEGPG